MRATIILSLLALLLGCGTTRAPRRAPVAGAVAMPERFAARAAKDVFRDGGNAIDAAVCAGFVLAVTHPEAGNLGGGGFLVVHTATEDFTIDAREVAPRAARRDMYLGPDGAPRHDASLVGPLAAGVPGSVAGYLLLHEKLGTLPRARLLAPAIALARNGFEADAGLRASLARNRELLARFPATKRIFLPDGEVPRRLVQPELARVLEAIARDGAPGFYRGWFAEQVQAACERHGGVLTIGDLYTYEAKVRAPIRGRYRGHDVITMPPPSSGGVVLLQILGMLELGGYDRMRPEQRRHLFAEASRRAFADRARYFGDPDFVDVPVADLLDADYLRRRFETISMTGATPSGGVGGGLAESEETCHFSVVDELGNAVSCTTTLNGAYGCGLAVSGVLLNNEMDDFTAKPGVPNQFGLIQSARNAIEPRKRPLSSMTPTILLRDGTPVLAVGSPGGPTIISTVAQIVSNRYALGMRLRDAVAAPRIHHQWQPDRILHEDLPAAELRSLNALGHVLTRRKGPLGDAQVVGVEDGALVGVPDPRGRGSD